MEFNCISLDVSIFKVEGALPMDHHHPRAEYGHTWISGVPRKVKLWVSVIIH